MHTSGKTLRQLALLAVFFYSLSGRAQVIANYVANGSFEDMYVCDGLRSLMKIKHWLSIDSISPGSGYFSLCNGSAPLDNGRYQYPRSGSTYAGSTFYYTDFNFRGYLKNRLKTNLQAGKTYCVKFYVNIMNGSTYGMDGFGAYFGDNSIDTITKCTQPITYLNPQVKNPPGNVISDTLNWLPVTGTFTANGTEKYMLIGNFLPMNMVDTVLINSTKLPLIFTDVDIDDVSCIEVNLPAYAGPNQQLTAGDSVFIGRQPDFAIDGSCYWYQLPNVTTAIDTVSGLWVKPIVTTTYVVRQEIECGSIKWDTVVVNALGVGIHNLSAVENNVIIYPNPAQQGLQLTCSVKESEPVDIAIYNTLGQLLRRQELYFVNDAATLNVADLLNGSYTLRLNYNRSGNTIAATKKLLIAR